MPSIINSDDGVISGTSGLKTTGGNDGALNIQANGTTAIAISASGTVTMPAGALPVASGGTGSTTLTAENVIIGNGTSAVKFVAAGTSGNVLTSNGTAWVSQAAGASGGDYVMNVYTTPGTWTKPAGLKAIKVTVIGGGGGSAGGGLGGGGGGGGTSIEYLDAPAIPGPQPYTVGTGGAGGPTPGPGNGGTGNTSSFGGPTAFLSATGGTGFPSALPAGAVAGGIGSNGQLNLAGGGGSLSVFGCIPSLFSIGGGTILGGTAQVMSNIGSVNPSAPRGYGVGGVGLIPPANTTGIAGSAGVVIVEEFY